MRRALAAAAAATRPTPRGEPERLIVDERAQEAAGAPAPGQYLLTVRDERYGTREAIELLSRREFEFKLS